MTETLMMLLGRYGYIGIIIIIALENIFPPIPSEIILPFSGFLTTLTELKPVLVILCATLGSTIGAIVLYGFGRLLTADKMENILYGKIGHLLHFNRDDVEYTMTWFHKKGKYTIFFCRCVPIMRSLISIPAGMAGVPWLPFLSMTIVGSLIWNIVLVTLGRLAGQSWNIASKYIHHYSDIIKLILIIIIIGFILYKIIKTYGHKNSVDK